MRLKACFLRFNALLLRESTNVLDKVESRLNQRFWAFMGILAKLTK
jgi:hypothetical protein